MDNTFSVWTFLRDYRKNRKTGMVILVFVGIIMALWGFIEPVILVFSFLITWIPWLADPPLWILITLNLAVLYFGIAYILGLLVRLPGFLAGKYAAKPVRALKFSYWLRQDPKFAPVRPLKALYRMIWSSLVDISFKSELIERLEVVTVPYLGGRANGYVTKVQPHYDHASCDPRNRELCDQHVCKSKVFIDWLIWAFNPDWPVPAIGRPLWWMMQECKKPVGVNTRDAFQQYVSLGMSAPPISGERPVEESDLSVMIEAIKKNEPALLVAGLREPEETEQQWIADGKIPPDWRDEN